MALQDKARDFWDRISPRERRLVVIAAVVAPITLVLWVGFAIRDGLDAMEARNNQMRKALVALADIRARGTKVSDSDPMQAINAEALSLDTYITNAAKKAKFDLKSTITPHGTQTKNGVEVQTSSLSVQQLTIDQLKDFLAALETTSKAVAVTKLDISPDFRDKDKLKADIEVSNYYKVQAAAGSGAGSGSAGSADKKGS
ncbi:MAG TPA: type II secretion system protein GspM [Kofleriaceae bacterium]